jgi:hypothetical protein
MANWQFTYPGIATRFKVTTNTANTVTVPGLTGTVALGTIVTLGYATGSSGPVITRDLVRTPRSFVAFENKDVNGNRDATQVTAVFTQVPAPAPLNPAVTGSAVLTAGLTLTDSTKSWTPKQYDSGGTTRWYYARVDSVSTGKRFIRMITTNTATALTLAGALPEGFTLTEFAACTYTIFDGAVMVRYRTDETTSAASAGFTPTVGRETFVRDQTFYLDYYATKNGCNQENIRSILVDPDTGAQFKQGLLLTYFSGIPGRLTALARVPDDDCKYWELYLRKGGWPVAAGQTPATGVLDKQYLRYVSSSVSGDSLSYSQNVEPIADATWYGIAVPFNAFNQEGKRSTASIYLSEASTPDSLLALNWSTANASTAAQATVTAQAGAGNRSFTVTAFDNADPGTPYSATAVFPPTISGVNTGSSVNFTLPFQVSLTPTANQRNWTITAASSPSLPITIQQTMYAVVGSGGGTPTVTVQTTTAVDDGFCPSEGCSSGNYRPLLLQVNYTTTGCTSLTHEVAIDVLLSPGTGDWTSVGWSLPGTNGVQTWVHGFGCTVYRAIGTPTDIQYRVQVIRKDNGQVAATATSPIYTTNLFRCEGYIPGDGEI